MLNFISPHIQLRGSGVNNLPANARDTGDTSSIPGSGRPLGGGHGNPLGKYSCLKNPMDRGAWWANSAGGCKESYMTEPLSTQTHMLIGLKFKKMTFFFQQSLCKNLKNLENKLFSTVLSLTGIQHIPIFLIKLTEQEMITSVLFFFFL